MDHLARWNVMGMSHEERAMTELAISTEKVGFLIDKARQFDMKEAVSDPDSGSNASDDDVIDVLQDNGQDPVFREITGFINALSEDERVDLVALMRLGRGEDRKSTRLNSSHQIISYAVFCLKKKNITQKVNYIRKR